MTRDQLRRRTFERGDTTLAWFDSGGAGLPVVFQHGLGGDVAQTAEAFPDDRRYRMITLECRGHGSSTATAPYAIAHFAGDLAALIEAELAAPVVLGGISMGAAMALRLAVRRPDLVRALALVRPAWIASPAPENLRPNAEVGRLLATLPPPDARAAFLQSRLARDLGACAPDNIASLLGFFDRPQAAETARLLLAISADGPGVTEAELAQLNLPTLVIGTHEDAIHPLGLAHRLGALIPGARLAVLTPKGRDREAHFTELHATLAAFLQEV